MFVDIFRSRGNVFFEDKSIEDVTVTNGVVIYNGSYGGQSHVGIELTPEEFKTHCRGVRFQTHYVPIPGSTKLFIKQYTPLKTDGPEERHLRRATINLINSRLSLKGEIFQSMSLAKKRAEDLIRNNGNYFFRIPEMPETSRINLFNPQN